MNDQPNQPPEPEGATPATLPWEDRGRAPLEALFGTIRSLIVNPQEAFQRMSLTADLLRPILYAVILGWVGAAFSFFWDLLLRLAIGIQFLPEDVPILPMAFGFAVGGLLLLIVPVFILIAVFIWSAILHLFLVLVGGANQRFNATLRVVCYAYTSQLALALPILGGIVALVWAIILEIIGLAAAHQTTIGKAVAAVLLPFALCCVCILTGLLLVLVFGVGAAAMGLSS